MPMSENMTQARVVIDKKEYKEYQKLAKADNRSFSSYAVVALREKKIADSRK